MNRLIIGFGLSLLFSNQLFAQKSVDILPASGVQGQNLAVSITGVKTTFSAGSNSLQFFKSGTSTNKITVSNYAVLSPTTMVAYLFIQGSATTGAYTYKLSNPIDGTVNGLNPFYVYPDTAKPKLVNITPNLIKQGDYLSVTLTGTNTHFTQASNSMQVGFYYNDTASNDLYLAPSSIKIIDDTHFTGDVSAAGLAKLGKYDVTVTNLVDGYLPLLKSITVVDTDRPRIVNVSPNLGHLNQTLNVSIIGSRTNFSSGSPTVSFFQNGSPTTEIEINGYSIKNDSLLDIDLKIKTTANRGLYTVVYSNSIDYLYKDDAFEVTWALGVDPIIQPKNEVNIYPNPAKEELHIESKTATIEKIDLIDLQGRLVQTETPAQPSNKIDFSLNDFMAPQQYLLVKVYTNKGVLYQRILVQ